jgi:hypothetical protein
MRLPAVCRDGVTRTATAGKSCRSNLCAYPGCVVSPVSVQLTVAGKRRTVTGRLELSDAGVISFTADARLSNADLIPLTRFKPYRSKIARRLLSVVYAYNYRNAIRWGHVSDYCEAVGECLKDWSNGDCRETLAGWQGRRELRRLSPGDCRLMSAYMFRVARFKYALGE